MDSHGKKDQKETVAKELEEPAKKEESLLGKGHSEAFKSLFKPMYEEDKDRDFLCRNVHRGLR